MTFKNLVARLRDCDAAAPEHEAAELVRVIDKKDKAWCLLNPDAPLSDAVDAALGERESGIPLQYVLGEAWFYGYQFAVSPHCLIPQPDTEHLVALALTYIMEGNRILDLCTGSGCIAVSILMEAPSVTASAVDVSPDALDIAKENARRHGVADRVKFIEADLLEWDMSRLISEADIILSNPPYINTDVIPTLSKEVQNEPAIALDGGADGMDFYRHFINAIPPFMKPDAKLLLEIGYDQGERVSSLCADKGLKCRLHKDFGGNFRVAEISL